MKYQLCAVTTGTQGTNIPFVALFLTYNRILYIYVKLGIREINLIYQTAVVERVAGFIERVGNPYRHCSMSRKI